MPAKLPPLHLIEGTDLRVGPHMLRHLAAQRALHPAGAVEVIGTHAATGVPVRTTIPAHALATLPAPAPTP